MTSNSLASRHCLRLFRRNIGGPCSIAGTASTCWLPTSWSPRPATTTWPLLLTSLLSPPLEPTWTCAPRMTSPSLWMPWCTTLTLTMRRWRLPTLLSCSTATSLMAAAWCALSWPWLSETTRAAEMKPVSIYTNMSNHCLYLLDGSHCLF